MPETFPRERPRRNLKYLCGRTDAGRGGREVIDPDHAIETPQALTGQARPTPSAAMYDPRLSVGLVLTRLG